MPDSRSDNPDLTSGADEGELEGRKSNVPESDSATRPESPSAQHSSLVIGPYKLLQLMGEGGMGSVWMAEQERPVRRRVALKLIKAGADNKQVLARFDAERHALSMMDHQNIAKVLDAGTMDDGRPYFVMELVQGIPFNKYCDRNKLSITQRLELFVSICKAVQHAHQKGIIHRDLKPSNVLVCLYDGKPIPKVIDFGLAKALQLQTKLTDKTLFTEFGQVVGTLRYMSPEQAELNQLDIDTRTDVYSLGAMLYELLSGSTPIDNETLEKEALLKVLETIREIDPPRPSVRLSSSTNEAVAGISAQRQIEPTKLKGVLRSELDWIVMKALEKDRTRRYETAIGFAADIERYLTGEPIHARPPSASYRLSKYVKRNKGWVASLASIAAILILGIIGTSWFGIQANVAKSDAINKGTIADEKSKEAAEEARNARLAKKDADEKRDQTEATLARSNILLAHSRWKEHRVGEALEVLERIPEKHRHFEWYLDLRMFQGSDLTLYGHTAAVTCIAFSPDGTQIASGSLDRTVKLWDPITGVEIRTLKGHGYSVTGVSYSPDGSLLATCAEPYLDQPEHLIKIWNSRSGNEVRTIKGNQLGTFDVAFSPDGKLLASCGGDGTIVLWEVSTGEELRTFRGHGYRTSCVAFSPDGKFLVSGAAALDEKIKFWNVQTGDESNSIGSQYTEDAAFSPDGRLLASTNLDSLTIVDAGTKAERRNINLQQFLTGVAFSPDGTRVAVSRGDYAQKETSCDISIFDTLTGKEVGKLWGHLGHVKGVAFSPDGTRLASASSDMTIKVWDASAGKYAISLDHENSVSNVAISPDSRFIATASGNSIVFWDARTGLQIRSLQGHQGRVNEIVFSADGKVLASASADKTVRLWDGQTGAEINSLSGHTDNVACVAFSPDMNRLATGSDDLSVRLWDLKTGTELRALMGHQGPIVDIDFSGDGNRLVSAAQDAKIKIWSTQSFDEVLELPGSLNGRHRMAVSPDGERLAAVTNDINVALWNLRTGLISRTFGGHDDRIINCVAFSADGTRVATGSTERQIKIWDAFTGDELSSFVGHAADVDCLEFSKNGEFLVSGSSDKTVKIWEVRADPETVMMIGHDQRVVGLCLSPDGKTLASSSADRTVRLWDTQTRREKCILPGHIDTPFVLAFSPDGLQLATGSRDKLRLWDARSGQEIHTLTGHHNSVTCAAYSPDGTRLASSSLDNQIKLWDANSGQEIRTLIGHEESVGYVAFSSDGLRIYSTDRKGTRRVWNASTGGTMPDEEWSVQRPPRFPIIADRWLVKTMGNNIALIDLDFKNTQREKEYREAKSRIKPVWHSQQAQLAELASNWYAATFHRAWLLNGDPNQVILYDALHQAHSHWIDSLKIDSQDKEMDASQSSVDTNLYWSPIVRNAIALPRGMQMTKISREDAERISYELWEKMKSAPADPSASAVSPSDLETMREIVSQHPRGQFFNFLGVAEFRSGNYLQAIEACTESLKRMPKSPIPDMSGPDPVDFAILAMCHLKLGDKDAAQKFREQLLEAMKTGAFRDIPDNQELAKEVENLFATDSGEK